MIPEILLSEILKKRCLLFLGAGFSLNADLKKGKMPDWPELTQSLSLETEKKSDDPLEVASIYENEFERPNLIKKLNQLLHVSDATPSEVHKKLARIEFFDTIVTTNFDFLLERGFHQVDRHVNVIVGDKNIISYSPFTDANLIKIHGDLQEVEQLVITKEDYEKFHESHPVLAINLASWFTTKTPLFIGYSLNDPHFLEIRKLLRKMLKEFLSPWFLLKFDASKEEIEECRKDSIIVINLDTAGRTKKEALLDFFCQIQDYIDTKTMNELSEKETGVISEKYGKSFLSSKDNYSGKIINLFSGLEIKLRNTLQNYGYDEKNLKSSIGQLLSMAITSGILNTSDISSFSQIRNIRNLVIHEQYTPTLDEFYHIEKSINKITSKIDSVKTSPILPIQIELFLDKLVVKNNEQLTIKGRVDNILPNIPLSLRILNPSDSLTTVSQIDVNPDKTFQMMISTGGALWNTSGKYKIGVLYGNESNKAETSFEYVKTPDLKLTDSISFEINDKEFPIEYSIQGGTVESLYVTSITNVLTVMIKTFSDGKLIIRLPRSVLDAKIDGKEDKFFVACDGEEIYFTETREINHRKLEILFQKGSEEIVIAGTNIIGNQISDKKTVEILEGSGAPRDDEKYLNPKIIMVKKGDIVTWINNDSASHTITSGTVSEGPDGHFDSSLFQSGNSFSHKFEHVGSYHYHCMIHPWKEGTIVVVDG